MPRAIQAVTAEDIQRVANEYFSNSARAVSMYTRKDNGEVKLITLEEVKASLPPEMAAMAMPQIEAELAAMSALSADELREGIAEIESQKEMIPPQMKKLMDYLQQELRIRLEALENDEAGASEGGDE